MTCRRTQRRLIRRGTSRLGAAERAHLERCAECRAFASALNSIGRPASLASFEPDESLVRRTVQKLQEDRVRPGADSAGRERRDRSHAWRPAWALAGCAAAAAAVILWLQRPPVADITWREEATLESSLDTLEAEILFESDWIEAWVEPAADAGAFDVTDQDLDRLTELFDEMSG